MSYAIAVRRLMRTLMPELSGAARMRDADDALTLIGRALRACSSAPDPQMALLSEGADNSGCYEHRLIAEEVGWLATGAWLFSPSKARSVLRGFGGSISPPAVGEPSRPR